MSILSLPPPPSPPNLPLSPIHQSRSSSTTTKPFTVDEDHVVLEGEGEGDTEKDENGNPKDLVEGVDAVAVEFPDDLPTLHVEARLLPLSTLRFDLLQRLLHSHLLTDYETLLTDSEVVDWREVNTLKGNLDRVWICESPFPFRTIKLSEVTLQIHIYQPLPPLPPLSLDLPSTDADETEVSSATVLDLPSEELEGIWENLVYEDDVKGRLLGYIYSTILFGERGVDWRVVGWNRVVLLHGPPGTGKTSLCKALAQKLAIRLSDRYESSRLLEINSHSLFSKWFSESGKLVQKLFQMIGELVEDEGCFLVVLIDEVESLTAARAGAMSGKEPSDALRVVNALLTQLDKLKHKKNCLVMTTSNLSTAIDVAFIDRADIKQYIGLPPAKAIYWILKGCLEEIMRVGMITPLKLYDWDSIEVFRNTGSLLEGDREKVCCERLVGLAGECYGMSGRTLRRLPVLAHAHYIGISGGGKPASMEVWLEAMSRCAKEMGKEMDSIRDGGK